LQQRARVLLVFCILSFAFLLLSLVLFTILSFNTAFMATSKDPAATAADGAVEKLYEYGDRLSESGDKSKVS
jgi:uncharacterized membrane protein (DUF485 family)